MSPERSAQCLREIGICFLFAPNLHPAMKQIQGVRRELKMRTMFNLLGPLTNPARASGQVVGVYSLDLVEKLAEALSMLGLRRALVVHGLDGLDEITITGKTRIAEAREGLVRSYEVEPEEFGMKPATLREISGGDAAENAEIIRAVLEGETVGTPGCGAAECGGRAGRRRTGGTYCGWRSDRRQVHRCRSSGSEVANVGPLQFAVLTRSLALPSLPRLPNLFSAAQSFPGSWRSRLSSPIPLSFFRAVAAMRRARHGRNKWSPGDCETCAATPATPEDRRGR